MNLTIINIIGLSILMGLPLFYTRLRIFKNENDTRFKSIQSFILLGYIVLITVVQYINIVNTDIYMTKYIVYIWLGFYFIVEPLIVYVAVFLQKKEISTTFMMYFFKATIFTFIWTTIAVFIVFTYIASSGAFLV